MKEKLKTLGRYAIYFVIAEAVIGSAVGTYIGVTYPEEVMAYWRLK